jgi:prepilin-type processing-associated H-X9-DG protein
MVCSNNLKQLGLAAHNYHDAHGSFAPGNAGGPYGPNPGNDWASWLFLSASYLVLPYVEQDNVYNLFEARKSQTSNNTWVNADAPAMQRLKVFICPSSPLLTNGYPGTNYLWSTGSSIYTGGCATGTQANGVFDDLVGRKIADITDGTSNTIMAAEYIPGVDAANQFKVLSAIPAVADRAFPTQAELDVIAAAPASRIVTNNGRYWAWHSHSMSLFNTAAPPNWKCQNGAGGAGFGGAGLAWDSCLGIVPSRSKHTAGVNVCFADGSVHFIADSISLQTWQLLGNAKDGKVLPSY